MLDQEVVANEHVVDRNQSLSRSSRDAFVLIRLLLFLIVPSAVLALGPSPWYWASVVSCGVFAACTSFTSLQPKLRDLMSPKGAIYWVGLIVQVLVPLSISSFGQSPAQFPWLPSYQSVNLATLITTCAFVVLVVGFSLGDKKGLKAAGLTSSKTRIPNFVIVLFILFGFAGSIFRLNSMGGIVAYFSGLGDRAESLASASPLIVLFSAFGPPFFTIAMVAIWQKMEEAYVSTFPKRFFLILLATLPMTVYSYNRAATVTTLLALLTVAAYLRPFRVLTVVVSMVAILLAGYSFGNFRSEMIYNQNSSVGSWATESYLGIVHFIQVYFTGPQFLGFGLEMPPPSSNWGGAIGSLLAPLPILGEPFRAISSSVYFNYNIYGGSQSVDQVIPTTLELTWMGFVPFVSYFLVVGLIVGRISRKLRQTIEVLPLYVGSFCSMWLVASLFMSIQVVSQMLIYFVPAGVLMLTCTWMTSRRTPRESESP